MIKRMHKAIMVRKWSSYCHITFRNFFFYRISRARGAIAVFCCFCGLLLLRPHCLLLQAKHVDYNNNNIPGMTPILCQTQRMLQYTYIYVHQGAVSRGLIIRKKCSTALAMAPETSRPGFTIVGLKVLYSRLSRPIFLFLERHETLYYFIKDAEGFLGIARYFEPRS